MAPRKALFIADSAAITGKMPRSGDRVSDPQGRWRCAQTAANQSPQPIPVYSVFFRVFRVSGHPDYPRKPGLEPGLRGFQRPICLYGTGKRTGSEQGRNRERIRATDAVFPGRLAGSTARAVAVCSRLRCRKSPTQRIDERGHRGTSPYGHMSSVGPSYWHER